MIISTTADLKKYVPVSASFDFADFEPYIQKAMNTFLRKYIGNLHVELANEATGENATIKNTARNLLKPCIANFGFFLYFPLYQIQLESSGPAVNNTENRKSPEWWMVKDARRELLRSGYECTDILLSYLEANASVFPDFNTNYKPVNNELLVNKASIFSKYFQIFDSRQTYLALQPTIRKVEDQFIKTFLCADLLQALPSATEKPLKDTLEYLQKAIVSFTVAKVAHSGLFLLEDGGLKINIEMMIDSHRKNPQDGNTAMQLNRLAEEQLSDGVEYLRLCKLHINNNRGAFTQCTQIFVNENTPGSGYQPIVTKSIVGL